MNIKFVVDKKSQLSECAKIKVKKINVKVEKNETKVFVDCLISLASQLGNFLEATIIAFKTKALIIIIIIIIIEIITTLKLIRN